LPGNRKDIQFVNLFVVSVKKKTWRLWSKFRCQWNKKRYQLVTCWKMIGCNLNIYM